MVQPRRSVAPVRKMLAAVLGTIAVFIMLFGAGMQSWAIVALGVAVLVLAISLTLVNVVRRGARAWVSGTAQVVTVSERPPSVAAYGRCELQLVVAAPGLPTSAVKIRDPRVPAVKWPEPGATLPVVVAVDDMRHIRIQWDEVMTHDEAELADVAGYGEPDDDLLDDVLTEEPAPWLTRSSTPWGRPTEPSGGDHTGPYGSPIAVRESGGPIVLEGTLVEPSAPPTQRRKPSPHPRPGSPSAAPPSDPADGDPAGACSDDTGSADTGSADTDSGHTAAAADSDAPAAPVTTGLDIPLEEPEETDHDPSGAASAPEAGEADTGLDDDQAGTGLDGGQAAAAREAAERETDARIDSLITAYPSARPGPAGAIHGVGMTVPVADLDRSRQFYRDILGFHEIDTGPDNAVLASGDTRLVLRALTNPGPDAGAALQLNLEVGDVEAVHAELTRKGADFLHGPRVVSRGGRLELWSATLLDPDGHQVGVSQWRAVG